MIIQYPVANEKISSSAFKSAMKHLTRGAGGAWQPLVQGHPYDSAYGSTWIGCYNTSDTEDGFTSMLSPVTYTTAYWLPDAQTHQFWTSISEIYANDGQALSDSGDGLTFNFPYANIVNDTAPKDVKIYVNGVIQLSGYTIDYPAGTCTFTGSQSGNTVTWKGYWLDNAVAYTKDLELDEYREYDYDLTTLKVYPVQNFRFDHWTSSTQPTKWTKSGTVGRTAAYFKPAGYDATLTATAGWTYLQQTVTLSSAITQCVALAVAKTTYSMRLRVSVDSGANWNEVDLTPNSTGLSKWTMLAVQSAVGSTTTPMIEFRPQVASGDTSIATLAYLGLINGGLQ